MHVTILADNDYYSAPHTLAAVSSPSGQRYARFPSTLSETHKTGLGSSAALVTALTASLLAHYLSPHGFTLASPEGRATLHNLAQAAHCAAQGKIGSGFDVAAAVYGSCRYRRFSPSILSGIGVVGSPGFAALLANLVDDKAESGGKVWDTEIDSDAVTLPKGICLRMCDVDHGTATVGMVKKVLAWREADATKEEANRLWTDLDKASIELEAVLRDAAADEAQLSRLPAALRRVRTLAKEMGRLSGADVEPDSQTALLDALTDPDSLGCYGGVCPGAGGLDAVALLARDDVETLKRLQDKLAAYAGEHGVRLRLLDVKGELEGVRAEDPAQFKGWI